MKGSNMKKNYFERFFSGSSNLSSCKISGLIFDPFTFCLKNYIFLYNICRKIFCCRIFTVLHQHKKIIKIRPKMFKRWCWCWCLNGEIQKAKSSGSTWASCSIALVCFLQIWALISSVPWLLNDLPCSPLVSITASRRAFAPCHPFANLAVNWKCEALHWWDIEQCW